MSRVGLLGVLLVILMVVAFLTPAVEAWSTPVFTKPWTEEDSEQEPEQAPEKEAANAQPEPEVIKTENSQNQDLAPAEDIAESEIDEFLLNFENLYGTWLIWTPGTAVGVYNSDGEYVKHNYAHGAAQGKIVISEDGSYSMSHGAWAGDTVVDGKWRLSYPREINGEVLQAIVLLDGVTNSDWAVAPSSNGKIRLLWAMRWADGSATWIFDAELSRD